MIFTSKTERDPSARSPLSDEIRTLILRCPLEERAHRDEGDRSSALGIRWRGSARSLWMLALGLASVGLYTGIWRLREAKGAAKSAYAWLWERVKEMWSLFIFVKDGRSVQRHRPGRRTRISCLDARCLDFLWS